MISRRVALNLAVFFAAAAAMVIYGVITLFGNPLAHRTSFTVTLPDASGLRAGFSASYNGVIVGTVSQVDLVPNGVRVTVDLDPGTKVPDDVKARVIRASAVGEQRVDLTSSDGGKGPALRNHAQVPLAADPTPPDINHVLDQVEGLVSHLSTPTFNKLLHESAVALTGRSADLRSMIDSLAVISNAIQHHESGLRQLLSSSPSLLDAVTTSVPDLKAALANTNKITALLANRGHDLIKLFDDASTLGQVGNQVLLDNRANLTCLLSDTADSVDFLQGENLSMLAYTLSHNKTFFDIVQKISVPGFAPGLGLGPDLPNQEWLRVTLPIPPAMPPASRYTSVPPTAPTKPGAACHNVYGDGVGPVTQANYPALQAGGKVQPPALGEEQAPDAQHTGPATASGAARPAWLTAVAPSPARLSSTPIGLLLTGLGLAVVAGLLVGQPYLRFRRESSG